MPTPREQSGALSEVSRLLQEGLQLLDDRTREVDPAALYHASLVFTTDTGLLREADFHIVTVPTPM